MAPPVLSSPEEYKKLLDSTDTFLLDCDGVIYHGPVVVPGVKETLSMLRAAGKSAEYRDPRSIWLTVCRQAADFCHQQRDKVPQNVQEDV